MSTDDFGCYLGYGQTTLIHLFVSLHMCESNLLQQITGGLIIRAASISGCSQNFLILSLFRDLLRTVRGIYRALILHCHTGMNDISRTEVLS